MAGSEAVELAGVACGVRITGRLPAAFRDYLYPLGPGGEGGALEALEVDYREIDRLPGIDALWQSRDPDQGASSRFSLAAADGLVRIRVECVGSGVFDIGDRAIGIRWMPGGTGAAHYFFNHALPLWLELRGRVVLHAGAVLGRGGVLALAGPSGQGKSTLAAMLCGGGRRFVSDDLLAIDLGDAPPRCFASPPVRRLWPRGLELLGRTAERLSRVHAPYDKRLVPVAAGDRVDAPSEPLSGPLTVAVIERIGEGERPSAAPLAPAERVMALLGNSLVASMMAALGHEGGRLRRLVALAGEISVFRLRYPPGPSAVAEIERLLHL